MKTNITRSLTLGLTLAALSITGVASAITAMANTSSETSITQTVKDMTSLSKKIDLSKLVSNGTMDQATADKVTAYMESKHAEHEAELNKIKSMSEEECKAYKESKKNETRLDPFTEMVNEGILTQTQADAISSSMPEQAKKGRVGIDLSKLVSNGTMDQATADKVTAYMESKNAEREAEMEKIKSMSEEERKAYKESKKNETRVNPFTEMVNEGILTQTQADAINSAMPAQAKKGYKSGK